MPLTTVAAIKNRLRLPAAADPQDDVLDAFRLAAEERILALTGFVFDDAAGNVKVEELADVQLGVSRVMKHRPLLPLTAQPAPYGPIRLEARSMASDTFFTILGEIKDKWTARVMPLASELTPVFPPIGGTAPWFRWRQMIWPVVKFTYKVDYLGSATLPIPSALVTANIEWAVSMYSRAGGGALQSLTVERVTETYIESSMPVVVQMLLARYTRELVVLSF